MNIGSQQQQKAAEGAYNNGGWDAFNMVSRQQLHFTNTQPGITDNNTEHNTMSLRPTHREKLSLERYIDLLCLLTGGCNSAGAYFVKNLSELERAAVKLDDLKHILALHGYSTKGFRSKQDILDHMCGIQLASPIPFFSSSTQQKQSSSHHNNNHKNNALVLDKDSIIIERFNKALEWALPSRAQDILFHVLKDGYYSFIPLPSSSRNTNQTTTYDNDHQQQEGKQERAMNKAILKTTPAQPPHILPCFLPQPRNNHNKKKKNDDDNHNIAAQEMDIEADQPLPSWLSEHIQKLSSTCQGTHIKVAEYPSIGDKVALVFMDSLIIKSDEDDTVCFCQGIHVGQITQWIGHVHDEPTCSVYCNQIHEYCSVRLSPAQHLPSQNIIDGNANDKKCRIEIEVDLQKRYRVNDLNDLFLLREDELADAWVLLEPIYDD